MECREHENRLLDYAYGLLDAPAAAAIRTHLANCPACTADLAKSQALLSRAAKLSFDDVSFQPPLTETTRPMQRSAWLPMALAAGVMLAVGLGTVALQDLGNKDRPGIVRIDTTPDENKKPPVVINSGRDIRESAPKEWTATTDANATAKYRVMILGPEKATPNKDNDYSISAFDVNDKPLKVRVTMLVKDAKNTVHAKTTFETDRKYTLPAAVWEKFPSESVNLHALATHPTSGDKVEIVIPLK